MEETAFPQIAVLCLVPQVAASLYFFFMALILFSLLLYSLTNVVKLVLEVVARAF